MRRPCVFSVVLLVLLSVAAAAQMDRPKLHIAPTEDGFEVYIAAAMSKKKVPVRLVENAEDAEYVLRTSQIEVQKVGTGNKLINCLFAYCAGNEDRANTSVQLVKEGEIVWSYSVNKGRGQKNRQSMAEAIAKHFKSDYLKIR
jgi:hypothetical protein